MSDLAVPAPQQTGRPYAIAMVCLGNICRSPIAAVVLRAKLEAAGLADRVRVASSGTGDWHVGEQIDQRAAALLAEAGYDPSGHPAQQFDASWFDPYDLVLVMDDQSHDEVLAQAPADAGDRVRMFRSYDPEAGGDLVVPDPWYGSTDGFERVLAIVERATDRLVAALRTA